MRDFKCNVAVKMKTLSIVLIVCAQLLSTLIGIYFSTSKGFLIQIMILAIVCMLFGYLLYPNFAISKKNLGIIIVVCAFYLGTKLFVLDKCELGIYVFVVMLLIPYLAGMQKINYKKALEYIMYILYIIVPVMNILFMKNNLSSTYDAITMGTSYAILPVLCACVLHFHYYRKTSNLCQKICYVLAVIISLFYIQMSYRGALVSYFLVILFTVFMEITNNKKKYFSLGRKIIIFMFFFIVCVGILNIDTIVIWLKGILDSVGISVAFIDKYIYLLQEGDVSHGRINIYILALKGFLNSPIWGNGISTFEANTGYEFPHNVFLQFLYDGGLLLAVPLFIALIRGLINIYKMKNIEMKDQKVFILLLFFVSIPRMMVSAESWRIMPFWIMLSMINQVHRNHENRRKVTYGEENVKN